MFDIGFAELLVIAVVALLVLGPERLPHAVRMTGAFMGKARRMMSNVRDEFEREVQLAEMQQRIKEQLEKAGLEDARKALEQTKQSVEEAHNILARDVTASPAPASAPVQDDPDTRHSAPSPENAAPALPAETFPTEPQPPSEPDKRP